MLVVLLTCSNRCQTLAQQEQQRMSLQNSRWLHSHEEDYDQVMVYRPHHFDFPPSRGRSGLHFEENGQGTMGRIAPTDGINWLPAAWSLGNDSLLTITVLAKGSGASEVHHYRLQSLDSNKLCLIYLDPRELDATE